MPLTDHPAGNYRFLPGIAPYSCGVASAPGFEIVHATLQQPLPYRAGFERIARHLAECGRPKAALCGIELRSPRPYSFAGFAVFNAEYATILRDWGVFVGGVNPVPRTNVAPLVGAPSEPVLYGFSYTMPAAGNPAPTIIVAGGGELPEGVLAREAIVALGDTSPHGMAAKAAFVMDLMENRLRALGGDWPHATAINVYTVHPIDGLLPRLILGRIGSTAIHGVHWHYSRPPIDEIEFEMDLRCVRTEIRL
ncbi:MAG: RidA family protein [Planctomycetia bacterium]|nr:RidA family protein [Planctomycetia bacterium]